MRDDDENEDGRGRDGGKRAGGGETTRWQSCKVLRVTLAYVMFAAFVLAIPWMATPWTLRWFIRRYTWLDGTQYCSYTAFMAHNWGGRSHRLFWLDQFDNSVQLRARLADYAPALAPPETD